MKRILIMTTAAIAVSAAAYTAQAALTLGEVVGLSETEITESLTAQGYSVLEIEIEDGEIEVEALYEGQEVELEISPETGAIIAMELEDNDDEDDDDDGEDDDGEDDDGEDDWDADDREGDSDK